MLFPFTFLLLLQSSAGGPASMIGGVLPVIVMFAIAYFLIFMPAQKQRKQQQAMLKSLENGQVVVTSGGLIGTILAVNSDDTLILRIKPDNLKLQVSRGSVTAVVNTDDLKKS